MPSAPGFYDQVPVEFTLSGYAMKLPSRHPLLQFLNPQAPHYQPYRESGLVRTVQALARRERTGTALDIGANVGDSCAIIYRHSPLKIICVEPSDFFFAYLTENIAAHFAERAVARKAYVLAEAGDQAQGLFHWGGTARPVSQPYTEKGETIAISDLLAQVPDIALLKVDIDGLDVELVSAALAGKIQCPIYFELEFSWDGLDEIRFHGARAMALFAKAQVAGYANAFFWDDKGRFFGEIALSDKAALANAINYMAHVKDRPLWGFDICLAPRNDAAFTADMRFLLSADAALPLAP